MLAVTGCSQLHGPSNSAQKQQLWSRQQQAMGAVNSWNIHARAALKLKGGVYNIGLSWQRDADRFMLLLEAPFGQGVFRIDGSVRDKYRLRLPDGQVFSNATPEALLEDVIGWSLPISGLEYWIRGMPQPDADFSRRIDSRGRARSISQARWTIVYLDYFDAPLEPQYPRRIKLSRDDLTLKLVIERWQQSEAGQDPPDLFPEFN